MDCDYSAKQESWEYLEKSEERLVTTINYIISNINKNRKIAKAKKQKLEEKQHNGYFERQTDKTYHEKI